jgi:hypothetical protein
MGVNFGLKLKDEQRQDVYENEVINLNGSKLLSLNEDLHNLYSSPKFISMINLTSMGSTGYVARIGL